MYYAFVLFMFFILGIICFFFYSCREPKVIETTKIEIKYRDSLIHDTAIFHIEKEVEKVITRDTISNIENSYARSFAGISGGLLTHTLESKPQYIKVPHDVIIHDTIKSEQQVIHDTKIVEREFTWWERVRLDTYIILLGIIVVYILIKIGARYLSSLFKLKR